MLLCRCDRPIPDNERRKIALFCNVRPEAVIPALDVDTIYEVPISYHEEGMDREVLRHFGLPFEQRRRTWRAGGTSSTPCTHAEGEVRIAVVGKYTNLLDSYKSLAEALTHGGIANRVRVQLDWVDSEIFEQPGAVHRLEGVHGILVPGGFGERGTPGKIEAVRFARERKRAVLRHLLRHADGGDRGGAQSGRACPTRPRPSSGRATSRWSGC